MGDYSRDTFKLTNVLHQMLSGTAVGNPRHYVGVRLQQGVPLLDSDWNELEDLRRLELRAFLKKFMGTGVPVGDDGFRISSSGAVNNFSIHPGLILLDGQLVINLGLTTYLAQAEHAGLPVLSTPAGIVDRNDVVFLDVWHDEVAAVGGADADARLMNPLVGVETATRIRRRWRVRVLEGAVDLSSVPPLADHFFLPLATLRRRANTPAITDAMVIDRRVVGLTVSDNLKTPVNVARGAQLIDSARLAQMLKNLRTALFTRLKLGQLPHNSLGPQQEALLQMALQDLLTAARAGEVQALTRNLSAADALALMQEYYQAQKQWLVDLGALGNVGNAAQVFITQYTTYLEGQPGTLIPGLKPALVAGDIIDAVLAQEMLNTFLAAPVDTLPEGSVIVSYKAVNPFAHLEAGTPFSFTFDVTAQFTSPLANEAFSLDATLDADFGTVTPPHTSLTFTPGAPTTQTLSITVNPSGVAATGALALIASSERSAALHSTQQPLTLTRHQNPPAPAFFFYAGAPLNASGQLPIAQAQILFDGRDVLFRLKNGSVSDNVTYQVTGQITLSGGVPTAGWSPLAPVALPAISLSANTETPVTIHVDGPIPPAHPAPTIGTVGTVIASAVVIKINGVSPAGVQTPVVVSLPFIIT